MGRFSFSSRYSDQHWFRVGTINVTTTVLITALASLSIFVYAVNSSVLVNLALVSTSVTAGQIWRLLTWPALNIPDFWVVIGIVIFWYFGSQLEGMLGRTKFLWMVLVLVLVPAIGDTFFAVATGQVLIVGGIRFLEDGVIVAFVATNPGARSFYDIPLWILAAVILGLDALRYLGDRAMAYLVFLILVVIVALLASRAFGLSRLPWIPQLPLPGFVSGDTSRKEGKQRQRKQKLRVVRDNDIDSLLDKISEKGIDSLTSDERKRLDDRSGRGDN